jgi:dienelactone hydrolase
LFPQLLTPVQLNDIRIHTFIIFNTYHIFIWTEPLGIDSSLPSRRKMVSIILAYRESLIKKRSRRLFLVFLIIGSLIGCTAHIYTPFQPEVSTRAERQSGPHILPYEKGPVPFQNNILQQNPKMAYQERHLKIPSIGENGQDGNPIEAIYYRSNTAGKLPLVIVLPIWANHFGNTYPPEKITSALRLRSHGGMHILRVLGGRDMSYWEAVGEAETEEIFLSIMASIAQRETINIVDISRLVDWAEARNEIDAARIGLIGFSHSAVAAGMVAVNDPRLAAVVLVMGGAHPHRILAVCEDHVGRVRDKILQRFGWTAADYEQAIEPLFRPIDAANYPGRADPSRILIFDSHEDECIPRDARDDLWEALGRPARISFLYGHEMSFITMSPLGFNWMRREIYEFFERTL